MSLLMRRLRVFTRQIRLHHLYEVDSVVQQMTMCVKHCIKRNSSLRLAGGFALFLFQTLSYCSWKLTRLNPQTNTADCYHHQHSPLFQWSRSTGSKRACLHQVSRQTQRTACKIYLSSLHSVHWAASSCPRGQNTEVYSAPAQIHPVFDCYQIGVKHQSSH